MLGNNRKRVLITGIKGQIGTYLFDLLKNTCDIYGTTRGPSIPPYHIHCDLTNYKEVKVILDKIMPDEVYNLASETNSNEAINNPAGTFDITGKAVMVLCEAIKNTSSNIKLFQACSSAMFSGSSEICITPDNTFFHPKTPYSIAKVAGYWTIRYYREKYGLPFYNGFIFNTESPLRRDCYLTKKISNALSKWKEDDILTVDSLDARKDWIHAKDVAKAIQICMTGIPSEYVFSTGNTFTIKELLNISFEVIGITIRWEGDNGIDVKTGKTIVVSLQTKRTFEQNESITGMDPKMDKWIPEYTLRDIMDEMIRK